MIKLNNKQQSILDDILSKINEINKTQKDDLFIFSIKGNSGTGKSTVTSFLIKKLSKKYDVTVTAPTHTATNVLRDMVNNLAFEHLKETKTELDIEIDVSTIHSFLSLKLVNDYKTGLQKLQHDRNSPLKCTEVLIVDEASMVSQDLFDIIMEAKERKQFKYLILVGDPYQLKPVDSWVNEIYDETLGKEYMNLNFEEYILTEIVRQAKGNDIITVATQAKEQIENITKKKGYIPFNEFYFKFINSYKESKTIKFLNNKDWKKGFLEKAKEIPFEEDNLVRALAFKNIVVDSYNLLARKYIYGELSKDILINDEVIVLQEPNVDSRGNILHTNNEAVQLREVKLKKFFNKDPVIKADYVYFWDCICTDGHKLRFVDKSSKEYWENELQELATQARYANGKAKGIIWRRFFKKKEYFLTFKYQYAMTVHKSQGSSVDYIYLDVNEFLSSNLSEEDKYRLFYVGLTRAKDTVFIKH